METKNLNEIEDDLVYKTMPRGKVSIVPKLSVQQPVSPAPKAVMPAPAPAPVSAPASGMMEGFGDHHTSGRNYKKTALVAVVLILLVGGGFFAYLSFFKNEQPADSILAPSGQEELEPVSKISEEWRMKFFNVAVCDNLNNCGDEADPDHDGMNNLVEFSSLTDPNNPDSDKDGLADGDEKFIFDYDPQNAVSSGNAQYPDAVEAKTKWNIRTNAEFTENELKTIAANIKEYGFHTPTIATLGQELVDMYTNFGGEPAMPITAPAQTEEDAEGALDRDTQRSDAIKQIGFALLTYKKTNLRYPNVSKFDEMIAAIKPLLQAKAVNTSDPKNVAPFVYTYTAVSSGNDFKPGYYSETQNQQILLSTKEITAMSVKDQANQRDTQRKADLEDLASALELYSSENMSISNPDKNVFPSQASWKTVLVPDFIAVIPVDPTTKKDYTYTVTPTLDSYALQATLENPPTGKKGYLCAAEGCVYY